MINESTLLQIRHELQDNVGRRVSLQSKRGRKKLFVEEGILEGAYQSIFTIVVGVGRTRQRMSYTYSELLTHCVELTRLDDHERICVG